MKKKETFQIPPEYQGSGGIKFEARFFTPSVFEIHQHIDRNDVFNPGSEFYIPRLNPHLERQYLQQLAVQRRLYRWNPFAPRKGTFGRIIYDEVDYRLRNDSTKRISRNGYRFGLFCAVGSSNDLYEHTDGFFAIQPRGLEDGASKGSALVTFDLTLQYIETYTHPTADVIVYEQNFSTMEQVRKLGKIFAETLLERFWKSLT